MIDYIVFFFNDTATTEIYTLSLHDALPILSGCPLSMPPSIPCTTKLWLSRGQAARTGCVSQAKRAHLVFRRRAEAGGYLPRGTKTWPLTPKPPSAVSKICTNNFFAGSGGSF